MGRWRKEGRRAPRLPRAVTSLHPLPSPVFSSPLSSLLSSSPLVAGAVRRSCSGDIIMSHFTRVLPSISPRININHPTLTNPPLLHTNNPFVSTLPPINTDAERSAGENAFTDGRMSVTTPYLFLPPPLFLRLILSQWLHGSNRRSGLNCP